MPQFCVGLTDPAGGPARRCIFAVDGRGGPSVLRHKRDGPQCAFCSYEALLRACGSRIGKGHIIRRLKKLRAMRSPTYEAAFSIGMIGLAFSPEMQLKIRRSAGERPTFRRKISWVHRTKTRLETLLRGKLVPQAPLLSPNAQDFFKQCVKNLPPDKLHRTVKILRYHVRCYTKLRQRSHLQNSGPQLRREWWKLRRSLKHYFSSSQVSFPAAVAWAIDGGLLA